MSDRVAIVLTLLVGAAGAVFGVTVMDFSWPKALLIAGAPSVSLSLALLARGRRLNGHPSD